MGRVVIPNLMHSADIGEWSSQLDLMEWFGVVPEMDEQESHYYTIKDDANVTLVFSYNVIQASVQTRLIVAEQTVSVVCHENAQRLWLQDLSGKKLLRAVFLTEGQKTEMTLEIEPRIQVNWSSLQV